ncbi:MAG: hypothetical protein ACXAEX_07525 [Promethearchaeota archaeon]|jgi:5-methyltetrahydrofolate--homocysteine methyltransferase
MILKEDLEEAKERMDAWWDHEIIDRPAISYYYPKKRGKLGGYLDVMGEDWSLTEDFDGIETSLDGFEKRAELTFFGGESIPSYLPNYGPGIMAAVFGVIPKVATRTVWFSRPTKPKDIVNLLEQVKLNQNNKWYSRLLKITEYAAKRGGKNYQISITDLGGVLDILSSFLGPTNILLTMKRNPQIIDTCRVIILEKLLKVYDKLQNIIGTHCNGYSNWLNIWSRKGYHTIQCDFSAILNPEWFKRFALPDIINQIEHVDYAIYHMDGPNQIKYLNDLLDIPQLTGIEWVPGLGRSPQGAEVWLDLYKKILKAEKNVVIDAPSEFVPSLYKQLDNKGLYVRSFYRSERIAKVYLPAFIGGDEGKLIFDTVKWAKEHGKNNITKEDMEIYLNSAGINLDNKLKRDILKETNSAMREKLYFA